MKHLVLGSEGQIGKYVCDEIEKNGDEVIRWDIKLGQEYNLAHTKPQFDRLMQAMSESDFVHFLAYDVGGSTYLAKYQNSWEYIQKNMEIMSVTFDALRVSGKPFYFASSQMANMTDSVYGQLKAVGESYTRALGGINLRFWNIYGYESDPEKTHVITDLIKMGLSEGKICVRTNGEEKRHFTHATDAARMLYKVTQNYDAFGNGLTGYDSGNYMRVYGRSPQDPRTLPLVAVNSWGWRTIKEVANVIGNQLEVPVFFSEKVDTTQTIFNEIPDVDLSYLIHIIGEDEFNFDRQKNGFYIELDTGIKDMIDRIKADGV